ncbi:probable ligand-gated ion channel 46 [Penaeus chinensis]|uniref:probable ligand-gated ion channel 46 n=1 Tax=Penaeus chinensis TaxID=139456 RepID=UPI001FB7876F|nr:probable ligand-gated ion channel 46 [Penaeus chinensis]
MLVLTTLLNQVSAQLPRNSYFKALDIWMFGAIGLIFSILIMQTMVDVIHRNEEKTTITQVMPVQKSACPKPDGLQRANKIMKKMQVAFPLLWAFLVLCYAIYLFSSVQ